MKSLFDKILFVPNENTKGLSFYRIDGTILGAFYPKNNKQIVCAYDYLKINALPFCIVGNGSNLLFSPKSKETYVLSMRDMPQKIKFNDDKVYCSASVCLPKLAKLCSERGLSGLEELAFIPGTLGGAIYMNAGAFGKSIFDLIQSVKILQKGKIVTLKKKNIKFEYRQTQINVLILGATLILQKSTPQEIEKKKLFYFSKRQSSQPTGKCLGSTFKNPHGESAGKLIDMCGLKGISFNDAIISSKHSNFILNKGEATYDDIIHLINLCKEMVLLKFGINLEPEIKII